MLVHALLSLGRVTEMPTRSVRQLDQLLAGTPEVVVREVIGKANVQVSEITHDSSKVVKGSIFCCFTGAIVQAVKLEVARMIYAKGLKFIGSSVHFSKVRFGSGKSRKS